MTAPRAEEAEAAGHAALYAEPRIYDLAFGYRDIEAECDFLLGEVARLTGRPPAAVLELAAGPASHAVECARRGLYAACLDRSVEMAAYAGEKAARSGVALDYRVGDMADFQPFARPVDAALLLLGSAAYLTGLDQVLGCFASAARALAPGGVLVLELPHPRELFGGEAITDDRWTVRDGGTRVDVRWGAETDTFDPVRQIARVTATLTVTEGGRKRMLTAAAEQRRFTVPELEAFARLSGAFRPVAWYGALDRQVAIDDPDDAFRLVALFQKTDRQEA